MSKKLLTQKGGKKIKGTCGNLSERLRTVTDFFDRKFIAKVSRNIFTCLGMILVPSRWSKSSCVKHV